MAQTYSLVSDLGKLNRYLCCMLKSESPCTSQLERGKCFLSSVFGLQCNRFNNLSTRPLISLPIRLPFNLFSSFIIGSNHRMNLCIAFSLNYILPSSYLLFFPCLERIFAAYVFLAVNTHILSHTKLKFFVLFSLNIFCLLFEFCSKRNSRSTNLRNIENRIEHFNRKKRYNLLYLFSERENDTVTRDGL